MKIGNHIILGMFEYNDQVEYTEGDVVFYTQIVNGNTVRRLFHVLTNVIGVSPIKDAAGIYYVDYFEWTYSNVGSDILTKSGVQRYLNQEFQGLGYDGNLDFVSVSDPTSIKTTGLYRWEGQPRTTNIIALVGSNRAYMIIEAQGYLAYRFYEGDTSQGVPWSSEIVVNMTDSQIFSEYLGKLHAMENLLKSRIRELYDQTEALTGVHRDLDSSFNLVEQTIS